MDSPIPPLNPHTKTLLQNSTHNKAMEKFQRVIFKLAESHPNAPLPPAAKTLLQDRLNQFVSHYKTPDHPPYSAMIERAIRELNEARGSSEYSISRFVEKEYDNLPPAHSMILKRHLHNLCQSGDIVLTHTKRYKLAGKIPTINSSSTKVKRKPLRRTRKRWKRDSGSEGERRKQRLIKQRTRQTSKRVQVIEEHQEFDEKEEQLTENGENAASCNLSILPTQEIGLSETTNADVNTARAQDQHERQQSELTRPEILKPPSFEPALVENSPDSGSVHLKPTSGVKLIDSERARRYACRRLRGRNRSYLEPTLEDNHSLLSGHSNLDTPEDKIQKLNSNCVENDVKELVENQAKLKGDEKYSRRRKTKPKQSIEVNQLVDVKSDHLLEPLSSNQPGFVSSNTKEAQEPLQLPPPQHEEILQEKQTRRRSERLRLAKYQVTNNANEIVVLEPVKPAGRPRKRVCARPNKEMMSLPKKPEIVALDIPIPED